MNGERYFNEIKKEICLHQLFPKLHNYSSSSSSYICHGVGPLVDLFWSHVHNYFSTKSPRTSIHFHQRHSSFWNPSLKKLVFCFWNHFLTADFTSSSQLKRWPFKCSFSFGNRWKSPGARSGLYGGCGSSEKSRRWLASLLLHLCEAWRCHVEEVFHFLFQSVRLFFLMQ